MHSKKLRGEKEERSTNGELKPNSDVPVCGDCQRPLCSKSKGEVEVVRFFSSPSRFSSSNRFQMLLGSGTA